MGQALIDAVGSLMAWADAHLDEVDAARQEYDARALAAQEHPQPSQPQPSRSQPSQPHQAGPARTMSPQTGAWGVSR
jgi:hypothetical protein